MKKAAPETTPEYLSRCLPVLIEVHSRTLLVLCPVSKLSKLPKALQYQAQGVTWPLGQSWEEVDILGPDGNIFIVGSHFHKLLTKALTDSGVAME